MIYDRNKGVKSIINAMGNGDITELLFKGSAMFDVTNGKITHNTTYNMRQISMRWLFFTHNTYPVYENNQYVGYYSHGVFRQPRRGEA